MGILDEIKCWVGAAPFKKTGEPIITGFGNHLKSVVLVEAEEWRKLELGIKHLEEAAKGAKE